jgi:hypothetical protein
VFPSFGLRHFLAGLCSSLPACAAPPLPRYLAAGRRINIHIKRFSVEHALAFILASRGRSTVGRRTSRRGRPCTASSGGGRPAGSPSGSWPNCASRIHGSFWRGGDPAARMVAGTIPQMTDGLLAKGLTTADIDAVLELLHNPALKVHSHLLYSTVGYAPHR